MHLQQCAEINYKDKEMYGVGYRLETCSTAGKRETGVIAEEVMWNVFSDTDFPPQLISKAAENM